MKEFFGINNVTFNDFLIDTNFNSLRNKYINLTSKLTEKDMKDYPQYDENNIRQIIITIGNSQTGEYVEDVIKKIRFKEDFLSGLIEELKIEFKKRIINSLKSEFAYDVEWKYLFISEELLNLEEYRTRLPELIHLEIIKEELDAAVENIRDFLEDLKPKHREDFSKDKIKFKISQKDLIFLFKKLIQLNIITHADDKRLGELLEKHFLYYDRKTKDYKEMTSVYNYILKIGNDEFRQPSEEIKKLFNIK